MGCKSEVETLTHFLNCASYLSIRGDGCGRMREKIHELFTLEKVYPDKDLIANILGDYPIWANGVSLTVNNSECFGLIVGFYWSVWLKGILTHPHLILLRDKIILPSKSWASRLWKDVGTSVKGGCNCLIEPVYMFIDLYSGVLMLGWISLSYSYLLFWFSWLSLALYCGFISGFRQDIFLLLHFLFHLASVRI